MRLPFLGNITAPAPNPTRDHVGASLEQMIAADLPLAAANQRRLQAVRAEDAKRKRAEDRAIAAMLKQYGSEDN